MFQFDVQPDVQVQVNLLFQVRLIVLAHIVAQQRDRNDQGDQASEVQKVKRSQSGMPQPDQ